MAERRVAGEVFIADLMAGVFWIDDAVHPLMRSL
jgi:hypothetical protein